MLQSKNIITNKDLLGSKALSFEWKKFKIGVAEYVDGPTGCTVFSFPDSDVNAVVDIRGGAPGSILTNDLECSGVTSLDAIVLAGGSILGLEAATGVSATIFTEREYTYGWGMLPFVTGSVIFDWINRKAPLYPDKVLGTTAYQSAEYGRFILGRHGAGINATIAKTFGLKYASRGGQGGAIRIFDDIKIAVFTVVNALGAIYDEEGQMVYGYIDTKTKESVPEEGLLSQLHILDKNRAQKHICTNTTLTVVIVNISLDLFEMKCLAKQVHNALGQFIRPFGTSEDGDSLYLISTKEVSVKKKRQQLILPRLGILITQVIREAIFAAFDK